MIKNQYNDFQKYVGEIQNSRSWASIEEIKERASHIDLTGKKKYRAAGIPIISDGKDAWVDDTDTHTLIFGATGSKKTRLFVMPTIDLLINAGESFIATDPKGELYEKTAGYAKANGYNIKILNLRDYNKGELWNPLDYPYELYHKGEIDKAYDLINDFNEVINARMEGSGNNDKFWTNSAKSFSLAVLILLLESAKKAECNVSSLANLCLTDKKDIYKALVSKMDPNCICAVNLANILNCADKTYESIMISVFVAVSFFLTQPSLSAMLSESSFNVRDFGKKKTAFYLIVPDEKTTTHFLVTTFIKQAYEALIEQAQDEEGGKLGVRVNFVLDEFCNIPMIPDMPNMISAARSRNIRFFLVVQSAHQLEARYGTSADTIKGNCENWVFLASKELSLLQEIQELCGYRLNADNSKEYLINTSQLQRFNKQQGEALHLFGRCRPFVSEMADIDDYDTFKGYDAPQMPARRLPEPATFNIKAFMYDCVSGRHPFPFTIKKKPFEPNKAPAAVRVLNESKARAQIDLLTKMVNNNVFFKDEWLKSLLVKYYGVPYGFDRDIFNAD